MAGSQGSLHLPIPQGVGRTGSPGWSLQPPRRPAKEAAGPVGRVGSSVAEVPWSQAVEWGVEALAPAPSPAPRGWRVPGCLRPRHQRASCTSRGPSSLQRAEPVKSPPGPWSPLREKCLPEVVSAAPTVRGCGVRRASGRKGRREPVGEEGSRAPEARVARLRPAGSAWTPGVGVRQAPPPHWGSRYRRASYMSRGSSSPGGVPGAPGGVAIPTERLEVGGRPRPRSPPLRGPDHLGTDHGEPERRGDRPEVPRAPSPRLGRAGCRHPVPSVPPRSSLPGDRRSFPSTPGRWKTFQ